MIANDELIVVADEPTAAVSTEPNQTLLAEFSRRIFAGQLPTKLHTRAHFEAKQREAIKWLGRALNRKPRVGDLTPDNIQAAGEAVTRLGPGGLKQGYIALSVLSNLSRLAERAWRLGLVEEFIPVTRVHPQQPPGTRAINKQHVKKFRGGVWRYYRDVFRPTIDDNRDICTAMVKFCTLMEDPELDKVDESRMSEFDRRLAAKGYKASTRTGYVGFVRGVIRSVDADRFGVKLRYSKLPSAAAGTLRELFESAYRPEVLIGAQRLSIQHYERLLLSFWQHFGRDIRVDEQTDGLAAGHMQWLLNRGIRRTTVNGYRAAWFSLWRFAGRLGLIDRDPRVKKLKEDLDAPDAWTEEELARILAAPATIDWPPGRTGEIPTGLFYDAMLRVGYWTALRRRALLSLRRCDVNLASGWLDVPASCMKTRKGKRFRLGPDAIDAIRRIWTPDRELLFPWDLELACISRDFDRILLAAAVPPSTHASTPHFHKLRRTVATLVTIRSGLHAAADLLGHSSTEITRRYVDPSKLPGNDATQILPVIRTAMMT